MALLSEIYREYLDLKEINPKPSEQSVRRLIEVAGDLPVDQYIRSHAKAFLASYEGQKTSTRRRRLQCLTSILNFAYWEYDIDKRNPFSRIIIKGEGKDVTSREPFSVAELKKLYSASLAYGQLRLILPILGETGCRLSEVLGLMKQDVTRPCIPGRKSHKKAVRYAKRRYKRRNRIERMFGRLKDWRRISTRYDRCPKVFLSAIALAATVIFWL